MRHSQQTFVTKVLKSFAIISQKYYYRNMSLGIILEGHMSVSQVSMQFLCSSPLLKHACAHLSLGDGLTHEAAVCTGIIW